MKINDPAAQRRRKHPKYRDHSRLFDVAAARWSDPETSHEAAASITEDKLTRTQTLVLEGLRFGPATDEELLARFRSRWPATRVSPQSVRSRRAELVRKGKVRDSGQRRRTQYGANATVWEVVS